MRVRVAIIGGLLQARIAPIAWHRGQRVVLTDARNRLARMIAPAVSSDEVPEGLAGGTPPPLGGTAVSENGTKAIPNIDFIARDMTQVHYFDGRSTASAIQVTRETAFAAAVLCYAAVKYRAENVAEPPLGVFRRNPDGTFERIPHELDELLVQPSLDYDMGETIWLTQASLDTDAKALWVKDSDNLDRVGQLFPFMGHEYDVESAGGRVFGRYRIRTQRGEQVKLPEDVVSFRYLSHRDRHNAPSPTDVALSWLNLGVDVKIHVKRMLENGMFPSAVIAPHHDWHPDKDEFNRFKALITQFHAGPANSGKPFVAMGGATVTSSAFKLRDMVTDEILDRVEIAVAMAFGIAPVILGAKVGLENSPWSQMSEARRFTYEDTIQPLWMMHSKVLTSQLLRPIDKRPDLFIRFDTSTVRALQRDQSQDITDAKAATYWTLDQRLAHSGQDPVGGERGAWIEAIDRPVAGAIVPAVPDADKGTRPTDRDIVWAKFDIFAKSTESNLLGAADRALQTNRDAFAKATGSAEFVAAFEMHSKALPAKDDREYIVHFAFNDLKQAEELVTILMDLTEAEVVWGDAMDPVVREVTKLAGSDIARTHGIGFDIVTPGLADFSQRHAAQLVKRLTRTDRDALTREITASLEAGESVDQLAKRIVDSTNFNRTRAQLIAQTESTAIINGAQRKAMSDFQADVIGTDVVEKAWLSARDSKVRPVHAELDDDTFIPIDEVYANGLTEPSEPRCRCTNIYRVREVEA